MERNSSCWLVCFFGVLLAAPERIIAQQTSTGQADKQGTEVARILEDGRDRILLDRVAELERRLEALEHPKSAAAVPDAIIHVPAAASAPAVQHAAFDAAPEAAPPAWSVGPIDFSGLVDGYYSFNANHPASQTNQLYNFDVKANQFSLNMAKLSMSHSPDPVGFQVDLGFGRAFDIIHAGEPADAPSFLRIIEQAKQLELLPF
jgi:Putative beta-barrel porin-2, OmpL-like. bbp2